MLSPHASKAQSIEIEFDQASLPEVLKDLGVQFGLDFIYAVRLVENQTVSCAYSGESIDLALSCVFGNTSITAKKLHQRQYILSPKRKQEETPGPASALLPIYNIEGYVVDQLTGKPLPGAHIYFPKKKQGTVSDTDGRFSIDKLKAIDHVARISYLGYKALDTLLSVSTNPITIGFATHCSRNREHHR